MLHTHSGAIRPPPVSCLSRSRWRPVAGHPEQPAQAQSREGHACRQCQEDCQEWNSTRSKPAQQGCCHANSKRQHCCGGWQHAQVTLHCTPVGASRCQCMVFLLSGRLASRSSALHVTKNAQSTSDAWTPPQEGCYRGSSMGGLALALWQECAGEQGLHAHSTQGMQTQV